MARSLNFAVMRPERRFDRTPVCRSHFNGQQRSHNGVMITPKVIANELGCDPKKLRQFIRDDTTLQRSETEKGQRYYFTRAEADEVKRRYRARFG